MALIRTARLTEIHGESAQHVSLRVENGRRPAGPQAVLRRDAAVSLPQWVGFDVLGDHLLAPEGRRSARAGALTDGLAVDGANITLRQAGRGTVPNVHAIGIEQEDRAQHAIGLHLNKTADGV